MKLLWLSLSALLIAADQSIKLWSASHLEDAGEVIEWIPGVFELRYCENPGIAFSMLENQRWLFIPISALVSAVMILVLFRSPLCKYKTFTASCILILAGGVGNLIDRALYGYVIDMFYFKLIDFPIFNFADCCVVIGAGLLIVFMLFIYKELEDIPLRQMLFGLQRKKKEPTDGGE